MPLKHTGKLIDGFMPIIEAEEGEYLLGGQGVYDGAVFEKFFDALACMNEVLADNVAYKRRVKLGKVVSFRGMVSAFVYRPRR